MDDQRAVEALISDLQRQIDQLPARGIKNDAGQPFKPTHYKRGLDKAVAAGGLAVVEFVSAYVHKPASAAYKKLQAANSLDLACEALVCDDSKPYAHLFTDDDRAAASERLAPYAEEIERRQAEQQARMEAARAKIRKEGVPQRSGLDWQLRSRRSI